MTSLLIYFKYYYFIVCGAYSHSLICFVQLPPCPFLCPHWSAGSGGPLKAREIVQALGAGSCDKLALCPLFSFIHIGFCWVGLAISQADMYYCTCSNKATCRCSLSPLLPAEDSWLGEVADSARRLGRTLPRLKWRRWRASRMVGQQDTRRQFRGCRTRVVYDAVAKNFSPILALS
jgi:hypothetical protein